MVKITKDQILRAIIFSTAIEIICYIKSYDLYSLTIKLKNKLKSNICFMFNSKNIKNKIQSKIKEIERKNSKVLILTDIDELDKYHPQIYHNDYSKSLEKNFNNIYDKKDIDLILHTKGGDFYSVDTIIKLLSKHKSKNKINVYVPYYALSAGTHISLYGDTINITPYSLLSPIDNQYKYGDFFPGKFLIKNNLFEKDDELLYINSINEIKGLDNHNSEKILENLMLKFGHNMGFTYQDFRFFGIKNLNLSIDSKIFELMNLLFGINNTKNTKFKKFIENIERKNSSKIFVVKKCLDLVIFLNNIKTKDINYDKLEIFCQFADIYGILTIINIMKSYKGSVNIYPTFENEKISKHYLLLLLSNKKIYFNKNHIFFNTLPKFPNFCDGRKNVEISLYHDILKQYKSDIEFIFNSSEYEATNKKKIKQILESSDPYFEDNIRNANILNLECLEDEDIIKISKMIISDESKIKRLF